MQGAHKGYQLQQADLTCSSLAELTVYNIRRLFALKVGLTAVSSPVYFLRCEPHESHAGTWSVGIPVVLSLARRVMSTWI